MARVCPLTGGKVLYPECLECEEKEKCRRRNGSLQEANRTGGENRKETYCYKEGAVTSSFFCTIGQHGVP